MPRRFLLMLVTLLALAAAGGVGAQARDYTVRKDVGFGDAARNRLDIYMPAAVTDDTPVLVFFYGGGWKRGSKAEMDVVGASFASAGVIVVAPDYRLYPDTVFPEIAEDCAAGFAWVWHNLRKSDGTPRAIFLGGHSAGAFNAALVGFDQTYLAADGVPKGAIAGFIGLAGPYVGMTFNFAPLFPDKDRSSFEPLRAVDGDDPPMLLIHGDADSTVPVSNLAFLADRARAAGIEVTTLVPPGRGHVDIYRDMLDPATPVRAAIDAFIARRLAAPAS